MARVKNPLDTEVVSFLLMITVLSPVDCVPNLTLPTNIITTSIAPYKYVYKIGDSSEVLGSVGIENGNCGFTIDYVNLSDGSSVDLAIFTKNDVTFNLITPDWWTYRTISTYPSLTWETNDLSKAY